MKKMPALLPLLLAALLTLTACGGNNDTSPAGTVDSSEAAPAEGATASDANDADVAFARDMIPHHRQALEMARMAPEGTDDPEILQLAAAIEAAQDPEIDQMTSWLRAWGEQEPPTSLDHGEMGHGTGEEMPGMMTSEEMAELDGLQGADWERMFLAMMIRHHEGAIEMARTQLAEGQDPDVTALAEQVVADQEAEIDQMTSLLEARTD